MSEENNENFAAIRRETEEYLKKIHQTLKDSKNLLTEVDLRIAETDKMLEKEGLTREQMMNLKFTPEQIKAVNEELKRRGMEPFDEKDFEEKKEPMIRAGGEMPKPDPSERDGSVENRRRKFGTMMQQFRM